MTKRKRRRRNKPSRPSYELFSPLAIFVHTILFTPLVGGLLVRANYDRLGDEKRAKRALLLGIGAIIVLAIVAWLLEKWIGNAAQGGVAGATGAMAMTWYREQKPLFEKHTGAGGRRASIVPSAVGGSLFLALTVGSMIWALHHDPSTNAYNLGVRAMREGRHAEAVKHFRKVVTDAPDDHEARYSLALACLCIDLTDEAVSELAKIPSDAPSYARAHALSERAKSAKVLGNEILKDHCY